MILPAGWNTYIGTAIKALSMLITVLKWVTGSPIDASELTGILGLYTMGDTLTSSGQAKQSTLIATTAMREGTTLDDAKTNPDAIATASMNAGYPAHLRQRGS